MCWKGQAMSIAFLSYLSLNLFIVCYTQNSCIVNYFALRNDHTDAWDLAEIKSQIFYKSCLVPPRTLLRLINPLFSDRPIAVLHALHTLTCLYWKPCPGFEKKKKKNSVSRVVDFMQIVMFVIIKNTHFFCLPPTNVQQSYLDEFILETAASQQQVKRKECTLKWFI